MEIATVPFCIESVNVNPCDKSVVLTSVASRMAASYDNLNSAPAIPDTSLIRIGSRNVELADAESSGRETRRVAPE